MINYFIVIIFSKERERNYSKKTALRQ